mgnify:CR=1 FL=1
MMIPVGQSQVVTALRHSKTGQVLVRKCQETKTFSPYAYNRYKFEQVNGFKSPFGHLPLIVHNKS